MLLIPSIITIVVGIILWRKGKSDETAECIIFTGVATFIIILAIGLGFYFDSIGKIAGLEAFCNANRQNYAVTEERTKQAVIELNSMAGFQISVENLRQSTNWSDRIRELRDEVVEYNKTLAKLRRFNKNIWISWMFANPDKDLKLIILER